MIVMYDLCIWSGLCVVGLWVWLWVWFFVVVVGLLICQVLLVFVVDFILFEGCCLELMIQNCSCIVVQYYCCLGDVLGDQWVIYFMFEGQIYQLWIDKEMCWMESINLCDGIVDMLEDDVKDYVLFSMLLQIGMDSFDFWICSNIGEWLYYVGQDDLIGEKVQIDGVLFEVMCFKLIIYSEVGDVLIECEGQ